MLVPISKSLQKALEKISEQTGEPVSRIVASALSAYCDLPQHTLFQVSTSGALVQGVYDRAVSSKVLRHYGDFGLGTFENLDGEMIMLDGAMYQVRSNGEVSKISQDVGTPFAMVTHFAADLDETVDNILNLDELKKTCDSYRDSENLFYAIRVDALFSKIYVRAMRATPEGVPLAKAAATQPEFEFADVAGTLVGIWAPPFSKALNVAGYHFHFISEDRAKGGHLLECSGKNLRLRLDRLNDFHLSLPESEEFLRADLSRDGSKELAFAEQNHR